MARFSLFACGAWTFAWAMPGGAPWLNDLILSGAIIFGIVAVALIAAEIRKDRA